MSAPIDNSGPFDLSPVGNLVQPIASMGSKVIGGEQAIRPLADLTYFHEVYTTRFRDIIAVRPIFAHGAAATSSSAPAIAGQMAVAVCTMPDLSNPLNSNSQYPWSLTQPAEAKNGDTGGPVTATFTALPTGRTRSILKAGWAYFDAPTVQRTDGKGTTTLLGFRYGVRSGATVSVGTLVAAYANGQSTRNDGLEHLIRTHIGEAASKTSYTGSATLSATAGAGVTMTLNAAGKGLSGNPADVNKTFIFPSGRAMVTAYSSTTAATVEVVGTLDNPLQTAWITDTYTAFTGASGSPEMTQNVAGGLLVGFDVMRADGSAAVYKTICSTTDSNGEGVGMAYRGDNLLTRIADAFNALDLGIVVEVMNTAWNGATSQRGAWMLEEYLDAGMRPDVIFIEAGTTNDFAASGITQGAMARTRQTLSDMIMMIGRKSTARIVVLPILPTNASGKPWGASDALRRQFNDALPGQCAASGIDFLDIVSPIVSPVLNNGQQEYAAGKTSDGFHYNDSAAADIVPSGVALLRHLWNV